MAKIQTRWKEGSKSAAGVDEEALKKKINRLVGAKCNTEEDEGLFS